MNLMKKAQDLYQTEYFVLSYFQRKKKLCQNFSFPSMTVYEIFSRRKVTNSQISWEEEVTKIGKTEILSKLTSYA